MRLTSTAFTSKSLEGICNPYLKMKPHVVSLRVLTAYARV